VTPSAPERAPHPSLAALRLGLARERALIALFDLGRKKGFGLRAARVYAFGVFVTYALAMSLAHGSDRRAALQGFLHAALVSLSWVVGALAALGTARALAQEANRDALSALARQRGFSQHAILRARTLAGALRVARLIGIPALLLVGVAVARGQSLAWALVTAPAVLVYAVVLGLGLALLAQLSAELSRRHPRALLAALILAPMLISAAYPALPSVPAACAALLDSLLRSGAALS
jgi:hypothetical protein